MLRSFLTQLWPGIVTLAVTVWEAQPWLKMFEGSHGSPHSAMEWLGSALSPVSPLDAEGSDVPYGYGARRPGSSSFLVKCFSGENTEGLVENPWP